MGIQFWTNGLAHARVAPKAAARAEERGWDGMNVVDSQNLSGDPFVGLALAARETTTLGLGTGVSNPATRHPAAAAAAIGSVQIASQGRAVFGVGRGDSALAHLGLAPVDPDTLERFATIVRTYLRGDRVDFDDLEPFAPKRSRPIDTLGLADTPSVSQMAWLPGDLPPVPVEVVATGPKALAAAGRSADRVLLAVGADPERVAWAADQSGYAGEHGFGVFVNVVVHDDVDVARSLVAGPLATFARFSAMDGNVRTPIDADSEDVLRRVHRTYDMHHHTRASSPAAAQLTGDFVDRFGVVGSAQHCAGRLNELVDVGVEKFVVVGPSFDVDPDLAKAAIRTFEAEVMPAVREYAEARPVPTARR